jgi:uncharacterized membrane protein
VRRLNERAPIVSDELPLGRMEALSDGVFAIAVTLIVLELAIPSSARKHVLHSILHHWPSYLTT